MGFGGFVCFKYFCFSVGSRVSGWDYMLRVRTSDDSFFDSFVLRIVQFIDIGFSELSGHKPGFIFLCGTVVANQHLPCALVCVVKIFV